MLLPFNNSINTPNNKSDNVSFWKNILFVFFVMLLLFPSGLVEASPLRQTQEEAILVECKNLSDQGELDDALERCQEVLPIFQNTNDKTLEGITLYQIGIIYDLKDEDNVALNYFKQAVAVLREPQADHDTIEGIALTYIGGILRDQGQVSEGIEYYKQAVDFFHRKNKIFSEAFVLMLIGSSYYHLSHESPEALDYYQQALTLFRQLGNRAEEGQILANIGIIYFDLEQNQQASNYFQQARPIFQELNNQFEESQSLYYLAHLYNRFGQYAQALDHAQQALNIQEAIGENAVRANTLTRLIRESLGKADMLTLMGVIYSNLGQYNRAIEYNEQALKIHRQDRDRRSEATSLNNIGINYHALGQLQKALEFYQQALIIRQENNYKVDMISSFNNVANAYVEKGDFQQGLFYYQQALNLLEEYELRGSSTAISVLDNIAALYRKLGEEEKTFNYAQEAFLIKQSLGDKVGEADSFLFIGYGLYDQAEYEKSLEYIQQALDIFQESGDREGEGIALEFIGRSYWRLEQFDLALNYYQQALRVAQEIGDAKLEALALAGLASIYRDQGDYQQSLEFNKSALDILQEIENFESQKVILFEIGLTYEQQNNMPKAIEYYKQAVELVETRLFEIQVEEIKSTFASKQFIEYEFLVTALWRQEEYEDAFLYAERSKARAFLDQLINGNFDFRSNTEATLLTQEKNLRSEITALRKNLTELIDQQTKIDNQLPISELKDTILAKEAEHEQLITQMKLEHPELASRVTVDAISLEEVQTLIGKETTLLSYFVTEDRIYAFIITSDKLQPVEINVSRSELLQTLETFRDFASLDDPHPNSLQKLYQWLIEPVKLYLNTRTIGVIPHNILHYVPFAALTDGATYLSDDFTLFNLPNTSVLRFVQENHKSNPDTILTLGNPTIDEPRLSILTFAEQEVNTIANLYNSQALVGEAATESMVWAKAGEAGILHLAAHGTLNINNPLFSTIHLAPDNTNDGRLEVHELYGLDLTKRTDLVVLSACETVIGELSAGDEIVGLNRAFLYAGTPTVIASLWNVDDEATSLLMKHFYTYLRDGMGKADALQQAQIEVRDYEDENGNRLYQNPFYWSAFVLSGDAGEVGAIERRSKEVEVQESEVVEAEVEEVEAGREQAIEAETEIVTSESEPTSAESEAETTQTPNGNCFSLIILGGLLGVVAWRRR